MPDLSYGFEINDGMILHLYNDGWSRNDISAITDLGHTRVQKVIRELGDKTVHKQNNKIRMERAKEIAKSQEFKNMKGGYLRLKGKTIKITPHNLQMLGAKQYFQRSPDTEEVLQDLFDEGSLPEEGD